MNRMFGRGNLGLRIAVASLLILSMLLLSAPVSATSDDQFGMRFDPDKVPSNTQGIKISYYESTTGVSLGTCPTVAWIGGVDTLRTNGGSPYEWLLQGGVSIHCNGSNTRWQTGYAYYDNNNAYSDGIISTYSTSTYSTLSGTIKIFYTGSAWKLEIYVSQASTTDTYTFSSASGTYVDGSNNDWTSVETNPGQTSLSLTSSFIWTLSSPQFYVSSSWQNWNVQGSGWKALDTFAVVKPYSNTNNIGVAFMSTPGVYIQIGQSQGDGNYNRWCISGNCPLRPSP